MPQTWTEALWTSGVKIFDSILEHPFLLELSSGRLDPQRFAYYLAQDAHYLRDYARALAVVAAKAPTHEAAGMFARHAAGTVDVEMALHHTVLPQLGLDPSELAAVPVSPTTLSYTSYLLATVYGSSFTDGLAAVLPCYWIYARVGDALREKGSPDPRYQRWIDTYGGAEFAAVVDEVLTLVDWAGRHFSEADRAQARRHFLVTCRYEWMFWDAAWRLEQWPLT
jgi:thiaminase (transcriptional activator TenA)